MSNDDERDEDGDLVITGSSSSGTTRINTLRKRNDVAALARITEYVRLLLSLRISVPERVSPANDARFQHFLGKKLGRFVTWSGLLGTGSSPFVVVKKSTLWGAGRGLFIDSDLKEEDCPSFLVRIGRRLCVRKDVFLTTYGGVLWLTADWQKEKRKKGGMPEERWGMALSIHSLFLIDAFDYPLDGLDKAHFANHTAQMKCNAKLTLSCYGHFLPGIVTLKPIPLGSEVLVHYSKHFDDVFEALPCADTVSSFSSSDEDFVDKSTF